MLVASVTLALTVVATLVVVVTGPPLRLSVVVLLPVDFANVNVCPLVGVTLIAPPVVVNVAEPLSGAVIVSGLDPPPELNVIEEAPVAPERFDNINDGVPNISGPPPVIDTRLLAAIVIVLVDPGARKLVVPGEALI